MADIQTLKCPSCGAALPVEHRFVRMVACKYCDTVSAITDHGLDPTGKTARMAPLPSRFQVGLRGKLKGRPFQTLGRVRYSYDEGVWDEWFLSFDDGDAGWLEEDSGQVVLSRREPLLTTPPPFGELTLGSRFAVNDYTFFVTERCSARIAGAEGQLYYNAVPGRPVQFVTGNIGGRTAYLEYTDDAIEFGIGDPVTRGDLELEA
jgi:hypothetical protein